MEDKSYLSQVKEFVYQEFSKANREDHLEHLERTVHWVKELRPEADDALLIAAYSHDIQHAKRWQKEDKQETGNEEPKKIDFTDKDKLEKHQAEGAEIIADFLKERGAPEQIVQDVKELIERHEWGGTERQDILKDADSLSFFENNVESFLEKVGKTFREEDVSKKFNWMYERISSDQAREIAKPWYEEALKKMDNQV